MNIDSKFITNAGTKKLKKRLVELINNSKELKFLVEIKWGLSLFSIFEQAGFEVIDRTKGE